MDADPWELMGLPRDATTRDFKRRYAELLKLNRPDDNPGGFQMLRWAYETCLAYAQHESVPVVATVIAPAAREPVPEAVLEPRDQPVAVPDAEPEPVAFAESEPPPHRAEPAPRAVAPVAAIEWLGLDRLGVLRPPAEVVDELLAAADPARAGDEPFETWFARCAELSNFVAREAIERELLARLAASGAQLSYDAFSTLEQSFSWGQIGFERRLLTGGMSTVLVERIVAALDHCLIDAQFARHLSERDALFNRTPERWHAVLGDVDAENAELARLHAERERPWRRRLRALNLNTVHVANQLFHAYAVRYGAAAVDRLFGVDAVKFWSRAHPSAPPNAVQIGLSALRWLFGFSAFGVCVTALLLGAEEPKLGEAVRNLWLGVFASTALAVVATAAWRWTRFVALPRLAQWREQFQHDMESYLQPAVAGPVLIAGMLLGGSPIGTRLGAGGLTVIALALIGFVLGRHAVIGAGGAIWLGRVTIANTFGDDPFFLCVGAALLPAAAWLCDRVAVRMTGWPNAPDGAREQRTLRLLLGTSFVALIASAFGGLYA